MVERVLLNGRWWRTVQVEKRQSLVKKKHAQRTEDGDEDEEDCRNNHIWLACFVAE